MLNKYNIDSDEFYNPEFYKFAPHNIIKQNYPFIGEIISQFNSIENEINDGLVDYINDQIEDIGWIVISEMNFSSKLRLWKKLLICLLYYEKNEELKEKLTKEMTGLYKDIERLSEVRNKIAHADWDNMNETFFVKVATKIEKEEIRHQHLKINEIEFEKISEEFDKVEMKLMTFGEEVKKLL